jgi:hypothetical protein
MCYVSKYEVTEKSPFAHKSVPSVYGVICTLRDERLKTMTYDRDPKHEELGLRLLSA